jgi:predicted nucleotide-binding protein
MERWQSRSLPDRHGRDEESDGRRVRPTRRRSDPPQTASGQAGISDPAPSRKAVMVIYGHDKEANTALFDWLRAIGLQPREWDQLVHAIDNASPYIADVLNQAFKDAQAVIAFFTPDERVRPRGHSGPWRVQARPNVLIEAGMALITHPARTILVVLGPQELPSDLAGRHYIRLDHTSSKPLYQLARRLSDAGCDTDLTGTDWVDPCRFPDRDSVSRHPADIASPPPAPANAFGLPPFDPSTGNSPNDHPGMDLALRGRLKFPGWPGNGGQISDLTREQVLEGLASDQAVLTGAHSALTRLMSQLYPDPFSVNEWQLHGPNRIKQMSARWQGIGSAGRRLAEARFDAQLIPGSSGSHLAITVDVLLANPGRPQEPDDDQLGSKVETALRLQNALDRLAAGPTSPPSIPQTRPFLGLGVLRQLMLDIVGTLWGAPSAALSASTLDQKSRYIFDLTVFTLSVPRYGLLFEQPLDSNIDFGEAQVIPGNNPGRWTHLGPIETSQEFTNPDEQAELVRNWIVQLCIDNGFQNFQGEVTDD